MSSSDLPITIFFFCIIKDIEFLVEYSDNIGFITFNILLVAPTLFFSRSLWTLNKFLISKIFDHLNINLYQVIFFVFQTKFELSDLPQDT